MQNQTFISTITVKHTICKNQSTDNLIVKITKSNNDHRNIFLSGHGITNRIFDVQTHRASDMQEHTNGRGIHRKPVDDSGGVYVSGLVEQHLPQPPRLEPQLLP